MVQPENNSINTQPAHPSRSRDDIVLSQELSFLPNMFQLCGRALKWLAVLLAGTATLAIVTGGIFLWQFNRFSPVILPYFGLPVLRADIHHLSHTKLALTGFSLAGDISAKRITLTYDLAALIRERTIYSLEIEGAQYKPPVNNSPSQDFINLDIAALPIILAKLPKPGLNIGKISVNSATILLENSTHITVDAKGRLLHDGVDIKADVTAANNTKPLFAGKLDITGWTDLGRLRLTLTPQQDAGPSGLLEVGIKNGRLYELDGHLIHTHDKNTLSANLSGTPVGKGFGLNFSGTVKRANGLNGHFKSDFVFKNFSQNGPNHIALETGFSLALNKAHTQTIGCRKLTGTGQLKTEVTGRNIKLELKEPLELKAKGLQVQQNQWTFASSSPTSLVISPDNFLVEHSSKQSGLYIKTGPVSLKGKLIDKTQKHDIKFKTRGLIAEATQNTNRQTAASLLVSSLEVTSPLLRTAACNITTGLHETGQIKSTLECPRLSLPETRNKLGVLGTKLKASAENGEITFLGDIFFADSPALSVKLTGSHNINSNNGHIELAFNPGMIDNTRAEEIYYALPLFVPGYDKFTGKIALLSNLKWDSSGINHGSGSILLDNVSVKKGSLAIENIHGLVDFKPGWPLQTKGVQSLYIGKVDTFLPMHDGIIKLELAENNRLVLHKAELKLAQGIAKIAPQSFALDDVTTNSLTLALSNIDMADLAELMPVANLSVSGKLAGKLPIVSKDHMPFIEQGKLHTISPGVVRYNPPPNQRAASLPKIFFNVAENLHYDRINIDINGNALGEAKIDIHIRGKNPDLYGGKPTELNIGLNGNINRLIRRNINRGRLPNDIANKIRKFNQRIKKDNNP